MSHAMVVTAVSFDVSAVFFASVLSWRVKLFIIFRISFLGEKSTFKMASREFVGRRQGR